MRRLACRFLVLLAMSGLLLSPSCSDDPTDIVIEEPSRLLPEPTLEYIRPMVKSNLTFGQLIPVATIDVDTMVVTAESTLTALVTAGVPLRDAWVTHGHRRYLGPDGDVFVVVRLTQADTSIAGHGFSTGVVAPSYHEEDMRHYAFGPPHPDILAEKSLELWKIEKPPGLVYFLPWYPDARSTYSGDYVLSQEWLSGPEFFIQSLIEAGVVVNNAWVTATNSWRRCQWGARGMVVEVAAPHPALDASGFREGWGNGWPDWIELCADFVWNYCLNDCPDEVELPRAERMWTLLKPEPGRIHWRAIPSEEYNDLFGTQVQLEGHLRAMLRARAPITRAWFPVMAAAGKYTYLAVEIPAYEWRVWWWGYESEPAGGEGDANRWSYVRCYDLRDTPEDEEDDDVDLKKPHTFEQDFEGDP